MAGDGDIVVPTALGALTTSSSTPDVPYAIRDKRAGPGSGNASANEPAKTATAESVKSVGTCKTTAFLLINVPWFSPQWRVALQRVSCI